MIATFGETEGSVIEGASLGWVSDAEDESKWNENISNQYLKQKDYSKFDLYKYYLKLVCRSIKVPGYDPGC